MACFSGSRFYFPWTAPSLTLLRVPVGAKHCGTTQGLTSFAADQQLKLTHLLAALLHSII
jgi:hypothetical protein